MRTRGNAARRAIVVAALALMIPALGHADYIANIQLMYDGPQHFPHGERAYVNFDYHITAPEGARFQVLPYADGSPVFPYSWSGCPVIPAGTGSLCNWCSVPEGDAVVDQYCIAMVSTDWLTTYLEILLPVNYFFEENGIFDIQMSHRSPSWLAHGEQLIMDFQYGSDQLAGVRIEARPFHQGAMCSGYITSGSPVLPASGSASCSLTYPGGDIDLDQIRFRMYTADWVQLMEFFIPVDLHWRPYGISNITFDPSGPEGLILWEHLAATFDYCSADPCRIWAHPYTDGGLTPGWATQDGGAIPAGAGILNRYCTVTSGDTWIDEIHLVMRRVDSSDLMLEVAVPARFHYGEHAVRTIQFDPPDPAILTHDERVETTFDYSTTEPGGVRVFNLPFSDGSPCPAYAVSGSPLYPTGEGSGDNDFRITSGEEYVDQLRYHMTDAYQTETLYEIFLDTRYWYGSSGAFTAAPETPPAAVVLGPNYPNPFNPTTTIPVTLAEARHVTLRVFDLRGRLVDTLADGILAAGTHALPFRAAALPSGVYLYTLDAGGERRTGRMVLLK